MVKGRYWKEDLLERHAEESSIAQPVCHWFPNLLNIRDIYREWLYFCCILRLNVDSQAIHSEILAK